jgi:4'-phosphopantetheinyl transferase
MVDIAMIERPNLDLVNIWQEKLVDLLGEKEALSIEKTMKIKDKIDKLMGWIICKMEASKRYGISPQEIKIAYHEQGKPFFPDFPTLKYNISHGGDLIVVAFSETSEVGIDVESSHRKVNLDIVKRYFTASESTFIDNLPQNRQSEYFIRLWTIKEAYLKMLGTGLFKPLDSFEVRLSGENIEIFENNQLQQRSTNQYITDNHHIISTCTMIPENNFHFYYEKMETIINFVEKNLR